MASQLDKLLSQAQVYDPALTPVPVDAHIQGEMGRAGRAFLVSTLVSGVTMLVWPLTIIGLPAFLLGLFLGVLYLGLRDSTQGFQQADKAQLDGMATLLNVAQFLRRCGRVMLQVAGATMVLVGTVSVIVFVGLLFVLAIGMGADSR